MREYQFYLNSTQINDDPIGWDESKRKIKRSQSLRCLFVEYVNDLTFHGDGYTYILNELNTSGYCSDINIDIYYRCSEFESFIPFFVGKIKMNEIEIDEWACTVKCNIEDRSIDAIIQNLIDVDVKLDSTKSINGENITSINNTITIHDVLNPVTTYSRTAYKVFDVFQFILNYISDNSITLASDYFSTDIIDRGISTITFSNPGVDLVGAGNVVIVYKNAFNVQTTLTIPKQGTVAATLNYIISQFNFNNTGTTEAKFYTQDYKYYNNVTTNGTTTITLRFDIPGFEIISVNVASTISNDASILNGMKNLCLLNGNQLRNDNTSVPVISFKELFDEMNKLHDLGISINTTLGVTTLRIEHISYFFDTGAMPIISLNNAIGIKRRNAKGFSNNILKLGDGNDNRGSVGKQTSKITWTVNNECSDISVDLTNKYIVDSSDCYDQISISDDKNDEKIFLFECETTGLTTQQYSNIIYSSTAAANVIYYAYNAHLTNFWKIINWFFCIKGDITHETYTMTNTSLVNILNEREFEYNLSFSEQQAILNDTSIPIAFDSGDGINFYVGFINELSIDNKNGKAILNLFTT